MRRQRRTRVEGDRRVIQVQFLCPGQTDYPFPLDPPVYLTGPASDQSLLPSQTQEATVAVSEDCPVSSTPLSVLLALALESPSLIRSSARASKSRFALI